MNPGDQIKIEATVLRVEGNRLDAQTPNGQLIQTDISNVMKDEKQPTPKEVGLIANPADRNATVIKSKTPEKKSVPAGENKADRRDVENKSAK